MLSLSVANGVLFFIGNMNATPAGDNPMVSPKATAKSTTSVDIASLNLFGRRQTSVAPQVLDAPETKLNLELQGVFTADNENHSTAIVAEKNKSGELFHIGDRLPGNAILAAVYDDHILIRRGSRMEKLMFTDSSLRTTGNNSNRSATANSRVSRPATSRLQRVRERLAQRNSNPESVRRSATSPGSSLRNYMMANRDEINQNPQGMLSQLGITPVTQGEAKGYKLSRSVSQTSLMQAGLQQGDVILSVNGRPVGDAMNDAAMIDQAMASKRVRVEVQRGSRRFFLTVPIP